MVNDKECMSNLRKGALDLINRQKAENAELLGIIEKLDICKATLICDKFKLLEKIEQLQAENKELKKDKYKLQKALNQSEDYRLIAKAKVVKEFAERLKKAKTYSVERHENIVPVAVIDWIIKEMVGENDVD